MPRFRYAAFAPDGTPESGVQEAATELEALDRLTALGLTVTDLAPDMGAGRGRRGAVVASLAVQAELADQLAVLFAAALPAPKVAEIVAASTGDAAIRRHFQRVSALMADGAGFADAMAQASGTLSPLFAILAGIGQRAGRPGMQMPQLALALRRQDRMLAHIGGALIYPAVLLLAGLGVVVLMAMFLAPRLEVIFTSVNQPVPDAIAGFTRLGQGLGTWGLPLVLVCGGALIWVVRSLRRPSPRARAFAQGLPLIGPVLRAAALARITRALHLMIEAGMPLALALTDAARSFAEDPQSRPYLDAATALENGAPAASVLSATPSLPPILRELFAVGEQTNTLPQVLPSIAAALENDVERAVQRVLALLTPALTLLIGGLIAVIVSSVMGAVLSVNDLAF